MNKFQIILILSAIALISVWLAVFYSIATLKHEPVELLNEINSEAKGGDASSMTNEIPNAFVDHETGHIIKSNLNLPKRYEFQEEVNSPPTLNEVRGNLTNYLTILHNRFVEIAGPRVNPYDIWDTYLDVTTNTVIKWDDYNRKSGRYHRTRKDGSIFVSISTYRDHLCPMTVKSLFDKAGNPRNVNVAIFQQNCFEKKCRTGVLVGGKVEDTSTDINCYDDFCASPEGIASNACNTGQIRLFNVNESESLGPYMARYLSAKFYMGEQYYLQIDSHSEFVQNWDEKLIKMVNDAPAKRPIISAYPPDSKQKWQNTPGFRMCDSTIAEAQIEWHIVRLEASLPPSSVPPVPEYAPFVAAGFLFGGAEFLHEVPFDPLLPWIFMGEEISMSARLWTSGYDIFAPTMNVLNHYYVRRHYPKFWETVNRFFKKPIHNELVEIIIKRVKNMLGYPECDSEVVFPRNILYRLEDWGMGTRRSFSAYMKMVGLDVVRKTVVRNDWCHHGEWPSQVLMYKQEK